MKYFNHFCLTLSSKMAKSEIIFIKKITSFQLDVTFTNRTVNQNINVTLTTKDLSCTDPGQMIGWRHADNTYKRCDVASTQHNGVYTICTFSCNVKTGHMMTGLKVRLPNRKPPVALCEITLDC